MAGNFDRKLRLPLIHFRVLLHAANMRHGKNGFISLPKEGVLRIFFALKNPTASAGFEPANLGTKGQHATSRPPMPLIELHTSRLAQSRKRVPHKVKSQLWAGHSFGFWRPIHRPGKPFSHPARATGAKCNDAASCKKFWTYNFLTQKEMTTRNIEACIFFINTLYVELVQVCVKIFSVEHITSNFFRNSRWRIHTFRDGKGLATTL